VSTLEERLRDAFRADADTVRPESVPAFTGTRRAVAGRARLLTPVAAAVAIAAIAAGAAGTSSLLHGRAQHAGPAPSAGHQTLAGSAPVLDEHGQQTPRSVAPSAPARGVPRFYVTDEPDSGPHANQLVVRDSQTGKIVGAVAPPSRQAFGAVAATAGDRTFVAAVMPAYLPPCASQLYQFRLSNSGQPGPLVALHVAVPGIFNETDTLAVTPDGRTIAYATYQCGQGQQDYGVIDLATRHVRVWTGSSSAFPVGLSLSADGRLLAFADLGGPARILSTAAPAGPIVARSRVLSRHGDWVALAGDGSAFYGCSITPAHLPLPQKGTLTYFWQAVGHAPQFVIATWRNVSTPQCMASLDPSGRYLLMQFPTARGDVRPVILNLLTGRTTSIQAPAYYGPLTVTW
jgi:hypothetical protein